MLFGNVPEQSVRVQFVDWRGVEFWIRFSPAGWAEVERGVVEEAIVATLTGFDLNVQLFPAPDTMLEESIIGCGFVTPTAGDHVLKTQFFGRRLLKGNDLAVRNRNVFCPKGFELFPDLSGLDTQIFLGHGDGYHNVRADPCEVDEISSGPVTLFDHRCVAALAEGQKILDLLAVFESAVFVLTLELIECAKIDSGH